jgi:transposase, IS5 family
VNRACRSKGAKSPERKRRAYEGLYEITEQLLVKGQELERQVHQQLEINATKGSVLADLHLQLREFLGMTAKVLGYSRRRVLHGEKIANEEKLFSMFEPHTQLINRGKQPHPIQFGHSVLIVEDAVGYICHYRILANTEIDETIVVGEMRQVKERLPNLKSASFDSGFHTPDNQQDLREIVPTVCIPMPGAKQAKKQHEEASAEFKEARQAHPGVEALIGVLQRSKGLKRCRDRGQLGYQRYVGLAVLGHNLQILGKRLLRQRDPDCLAAKSKRKAWTAVA